MKFNMLKEKQMVQNIISLHDLFNVQDQRPVLYVVVQMLEIAAKSSFLHVSLSFTNKEKMH